MTLVHPEFLVTTDWLADHLGDADVRVLDSTVFLRPPAPDADRRSYVQESGRSRYDEAHIPGALFADLIHDLSDTSARLPFTRPSAAQFATAMSALGIGNNTHVVCYDQGGAMWATRMWWLLRSFGHQRASVLDGGWKKWTAENRATTSEVPAIHPVAYTPQEKAAAWADKEEVLAAIASGGGACVINALTPEQHAGNSSAYGRAGHIAGSVNVSARDLLDPATGAFLAADVLRDRFSNAGATGANRVITYCGGGIAATADAFVLSLLGHENVGVYDNSLSEWARDESLPME